MYSLFFRPECMHASEKRPFIVKKKDMGELWMCYQSYPIEQGGVFVPHKPDKGGAQAEIWEWEFANMWSELICSSFSFLYSDLFLF